MSARTLIVSGIVVAVVIILTTYLMPINFRTVTNPPNTTMRFNQTAMLERGNIEMGFNQSLIHHYFMATSTDGEIMIMSTNMSDTKTVNEIRSHVRDIQYEFSQGNFTKPSIFTHKIFQELMS